MKNKNYLVKVILLIFVINCCSIKGFAAGSNGYVWPTPGVSTISQKYSNAHKALDIAAPIGTTIIATKSGTVVSKYTGCNSVSKGSYCANSCNPNHGLYTSNGRAYCNNGFGNGLIIHHDDGTWAEYAHMKNDSIPSNVIEGGRIEQGQFIGQTGSSGISTGPHLHFQLCNSFNGAYFTYRDRYSLDPLTVVSNNDVVTTLDAPSIYVSDCYSHEDVVISWSSVNMASRYGLTVRKAPYTSDAFDSIVYGNSMNIGKLEAGSYRVYMAAYSEAGIRGKVSQVDFTVEGDTEPPKITNAKVSNVSTTGYTVTCNVTDNIGVTKVQHPTWTAAGGQDDLASNWESNSSVSGTISGNTVTFRVKDADHNYEKGTYTTHIYAYDAAGNRTKVELPDVMVSNKGNKVSSTTYKGHTYILYDDNLTWKKAKEQCEKLGGHLAIISSKSENDAIISLMDKAGRNGYWIGAYRVLDTYIWLDGSSLTYNNWAANEPNNTNNMEDVAEIWKSGIWNDNARSDMSRGFILEIEPIAVTSVSLNKTAAALKTGETLQLTATVLPVNAADKSVVWTTSNSSVATVSNGKVYAKAEGKAVITAKAGGKQKQCSITVQEKNKNIAVKSIKLSKTNATLAKGNSIQLTASITPSNATNKSIEWSGNNNEVAIVSNSGKVTAKSVGTAVITAKIEGKTAKATIKVIPQKIKGVKPVKSGKDYIELSWKRQSGISGYTIYRYDSKYKKDVGIITIKESDTTKYKITRVNGLSGKKLTDGTAYTFKIAAYKTVNGKKIYGEKAAIVTATATKSPTIKLTRGKSKTIKVSWNKVNKADGYEVYMSKKKSSGYKKLKSLAGNGKTRYTTGKLDKNKIYYFRVRTYKKVKGKNIYSEYSKIKSIRIK